MATALGATLTGINASPAVSASVGGARRLGLVRQFAQFGPLDNHEDGCKKPAINSRSFGPVATHDIPLEPSSADNDEPTRRDVLLIAAGGCAIVGGAAALWPLLDQMNPDASTLSLATTEVDISHVEPGQALTVMWRGKPIFIRHRTDQEIAKAKDTPLDDLIDPLARNANLPENAPASDDNRAAKDREPWLVMIGVCTHLGCIPQGAGGRRLQGRVRRLVLSLPRLAI